MISTPAFFRRPPSRHCASRFCSVNAFIFVTLSRDSFMILSSDSRVSASPRRSLRPATTSFTTWSSCSGSLSGSTFPVMIFAMICLAVLSYAFLPKTCLAPVFCSSLTSVPASAETNTGPRTTRNNTIAQARFVVSAPPGVIHKRGGLSTSP